MLTIADPLTGSTEEVLFDETAFANDQNFKHLSEAAKSLIESKGHTVLYLGGGLTCLTQVADTYLHYVLSQSMKRLEEADSVKQLQLCPSRLPVASNE